MGVGQHDKEFKKAGNPSGASNEAIAAKVSQWSELSAGITQAASHKSDPSPGGGSSTLEDHHHTVPISYPPYVGVLKIMRIF
jgi:hypothetical protein